MAPCKLFPIVLTFFCALPAAALQNYRATYHLNVRGLGAGTMVHEAFFTATSYHIDTLATPSLAARIIGFGEIRESSRGRLEKSRVVPQYYRRVMHGKDKYHLVYDFLEKRHEIKARIGNTAKILRYDADAPPLDMLSMVVQSLLDIAGNHPAERYTIVSEDDIKTYRIERLPDEKWASETGAAMTVRVYRQSNGNKETRIYFAEHPLRLVKLAQLKNHKSRFALRLLDYQTLE